MLASVVAGFLLQCMLNFFCHTSINLIVQNKWANFWSRRLCLQDKGGDLLTSSDSKSVPSFANDNWVKPFSFFVLLLHNPVKPIVDLPFGLILWNHLTDHNSLLCHYVVMAKFLVAFGDLWEDGEEETFAFWSTSVWLSV